MTKSFTAALAILALLTGIAAARAEDMPPQPKPAAAAPLQQLQAIDAPAAKLDVPPMPSKDCPGIDLGAQHNYDPFIELRRRVASIEIMNANASQMFIKGGNGVDTLHINDSGWFDIDGNHLKSVEVYDLLNGVPNAARIFAAGLASMNGRHALIFGDKDGDAVYLDPCLQWEGPVAIDDGPEPLQRYDARDKDGNKVSVSVTVGVKVVIPGSK